MSAIVCNAGLYARVSTTDQENGLQVQLEALRRYAAARAWPAKEFVDRLTGSTPHRPGLEALLEEVHRRTIDVVVCTKLDRLARNTRHLINLGEDLARVGVDLVVVDQAIDTTTATGRLLFNVLAAVAEFERDLIRERILAGQQRARARGVRFGRPRIHEIDPIVVMALVDQDVSIRAIARRLGRVSPEIIRRLIKRSRAQEESHAGA